MPVLSMSSVSSRDSSVRNSTTEMRSSPKAGGLKHACGSECEPLSACRDLNLWDTGQRRRETG